MRQEILIGSNKTAIIYNNNDHQEAVQVLELLLKSH